MKENKFAQSKTLVIFLIFWTLIALYPGITNLYHFIYWGPINKSVGLPAYSIFDLLFIILFFELALFFGYYALILNSEQIIISEKGIKHINLHRTIAIRWDEKPTIEFKPSYGMPGTHTPIMHNCTIKTETKIISFIYSHIKNWKEASSLIDKYRIDN